MHVSGMFPLLSPNGQQPVQEPRRSRRSRPSSRRGAPLAKDKRESPARCRREVQPERRHAALLHAAARSDAVFGVHAHRAAAACDRLQQQQLRVQRRHQCAAATHAATPVGGASLARKSSCVRSPPPAAFRSRYQAACARASHAPSHTPLDRRPLRSRPAQWRTTCRRRRRESTTPTGLARAARPTSFASRRRTRRSRTCRG